MYVYSKTLRYRVIGSSKMAVEVLVALENSKSSRCSTEMRINRKEFYFVTNGFVNEWKRHRTAQNEVRHFRQIQPQILSPLEFIPSFDFTHLVLRHGLDNEKTKSFLGLIAMRPLYSNVRTLQQSLSFLMLLFAHGLRWQRKWWTPKKVDLAPQELIQTVMYDICILHIHVF